MSNLGRQFDTFYHRTDSDSAEKILRSGRLKPSAAEQQVFAANVLTGRAKAFGKSVIEVKVPKKAARTDYSDNASYGEKWYGFSPRDVHVVRGWSEI